MRQLLASERLHRQSLVQEGRATWRPDKCDGSSAIAGYPSLASKPFHWNRVGLPPEVTFRHRSRVAMPGVTLKRHGTCKTGQ